MSEGTFSPVVADILSFLKTVFVLSNILSVPEFKIRDRERVKFTYMTF